MEPTSNRPKSIVEESPATPQIKVSKLTYEPKRAPNKFALKSMHSQMQRNINTKKFADPSEKSAGTFKSKNINTPEQLAPVTKTKSEEFLKKKLEREKDIEDIEKMLQQINSTYKEDNTTRDESKRSEFYKSHDELKKIAYNSSDKNHRLLEFSPPASAEGAREKILDSASRPEIITAENGASSHISGKNNINTVVGQQSLQRRPIVNRSDQINSQSGLNKEPIAQPSNRLTQMQRSVTDLTQKSKNVMEFSPPHQTTRSKSSTNFSAETSDNSARKYYDPEDARRFMKKQRLKAKQADKERISGPASNKEEIKKRLANLRKNSLKILERNLKKTAKPAIQESEIFEETPRKPVDIDRKTFAKSEKNILKLPNSKKVPRNPQTNQQSLNLKQEIVSKKIGLLRKPEMEEHSFSGLDKENLLEENLINMLPKSDSIQIEILEKVSENDITAIDFEKSHKDEKIDNKKENLPEMTQDETTRILKYIPESSRLFQPLQASSKTSSKAVELIVPDVKLDTKVSLHEKSIQCEPEKTLKQQIPYWLHPTPVQIYPYNFIMAVRKKLEAITNPVIPTNKVQQQLYFQPSNETPVSYPRDRKEAVCRRILNSNQNELQNNANILFRNNQHFSQNPISEMKKQTERIFVSNKKNQKYSPFDSRNEHKNRIQTSKAEPKRLNEDSKSPSELTSNFSSISINIPSSEKEHRKSAKFLSSTKIDETFTEDDTTISSSVFSSPEKKAHKPKSESIFSSKKNIYLKDSNKNHQVDSCNQISPLTIENITNLKIQPKSLVVDQLKVPKNNLVIKEKDEQIDINQLLSDFNRSLSQVIEVNEKLKATVDKSQKNVISGRLKLDENLNSENDINETISSKNGGYTSDFEKSHESLKKLRETVIVQSSKRFSVNEIMKFNSNIENLTPFSDSNSETIISKTDSIQTTPKSSKSSVINEIFTSRKFKVISTKRLDKPIIPNIDNRRNLEKHSTTDSDITEMVSENSVPSKVTSSISLINSYSQESFQLGTISQKTSTDKSSYQSHNLRDSIEENKNVAEPRAHVIEKNTFSANDLKEHLIENNNLLQNPNQSINQFSKDSLDLDESANHFPDHINTFRGDFNIEASKSEENPPPSYNAVDKIPNTDKKVTALKNNILDSSVGSEFIAVFNQSDVEFSIYSESNMSETTLNYSSIGMYEQLLQNESNKTEQLTALLKIREKVLLDRTKGQIAWLEVRKEKLRAQKGNDPMVIGHIATIKKKQRAILMKMEKEREEIKKLIQNQTVKHSTEVLTKPKSYRSKLVENLSDITIRKSFTRTQNQNRRSTMTMVRGIELGDGNQNLEIVLKNREEELRKRREQVEKLIDWHERLDKEEEEVLQMEQMLYECNLIEPAAPQSNLVENEAKMDKKLKEIDKSLRGLQTITSDTDQIDYVRVTGNKLNKLWNRLTGQKTEKFNPNINYKLCKPDLEKVYEQAKKIVMRDFKNIERDLIEQSKLENSCSSRTSSSNINIEQIGKEVQTETKNKNVAIEIELKRGSDQKYDDCIENLMPIELKDFTGYISQKDAVSFENIEKELGSNSNSKEFQSLIFPSTESQTISNTSYQLVDADTENISKQNLTESEEKTNKTIEFLLEEFKNKEKTIALADNETAIDNSINQISTKNEDNLYEHSEKTLNDNISEISSLNISTEIESEIKSNSNALKAAVQTTDDFEARSSVIISQISSDKTLSNLSEISEEQNKFILEKFAENISEEKNSTSETKTNLDNKSSQNSANDSAENISVGNETKIPDNPNTESNSKSSSKTADLLGIIKNSNSTEHLNKSKMEMLNKDQISEKSIEEQICSKNEENFEYENDFFESDTIIEDISIPKFESTLEETKSTVGEEAKSLAEEIFDSENHLIELSKTKESFLLKIEQKTELEKRLIDIDVSLQDLNDTFERALSPDKSLSSPLINSAGILMKSTNEQKNDFDKTKMKTNFQMKSIIENSHEPSTAQSIRMPDIISEVEIRRRQQILIENEIKHLEHAIPYVIPREIPNKPPPPYVAPAPGSPMTIIFPSENRIREITFRRTEELYDEIINADDLASNVVSKPSKKTLSDENITNIYERIVLDICKEYIKECKDALIDSNPETYKSPLALFNPPDKLKFIQEFIYKKVRKFIGIDKQMQNLNINKSAFIARRRDNVDDILIQELFEEESKWTNFDMEEQAVKEAIIDEIFNDIIKEVVNEVVAGQGDSPPIETGMNATVNGTTST